jgi:hypothetical protein
MLIHAGYRDIKLILQGVTFDEEAVKLEFYILWYDDNMLMRNILN